MEPWQKSWRDGIQPQLTNGQLVALGNAMSRDDHALVQGIVASPCVDGGGDELTCKSACAIGYAFMAIEPGNNTGWVMDMFELVTKNAKRLTGYPLCVEEFTMWFDQEPRRDVFAKLLAEIDRELTNRAVPHAFSTLPN